MKTTKWKVFIAECLCMCFVGSYSFTSPYSRVIKCNTRRYFVPRNNVPVELTTLDKLDRGALSELTRPQNNLLLPNTDIVTLSGGENLGFILWSYILCNGLFPVLGKPTNWLVTPIAKLLNQTEEQWYLDKQDGFAFTCPPMVDFIRIAIFCILGFFVNRLVIASFSGDVFWSWSIGICLAIPSALINAAREPLETRTSSNLQVGYQLTHFCT